MPQTPLDGRPAKLKTLILSTIKSIAPEEATAEELQEIETILDIATPAIVEAFDILKS